jgi:dCTP deaminase
VALSFQTQVVYLPKSAAFMSVLSDWQIRQFCERGMVRPFDPTLVGPASLDVRLGEEIMVEAPHTPTFHRISIADKTASDPYWLKPGEFILAHTQETFYLPESICAWFALKSSRGREGISHALAGFCDPGWNNSKLTLELHSMLKSHQIAIWPGMLIGQMVFVEMSASPQLSYAVTGRYNNCDSVEASRG